MLKLDFGTKITEMPEITGSKFKLGPGTSDTVERLTAHVAKRSQDIAQESEMRLKTEGDLASYLAVLDHHIVEVALARNEIRSLIGIAGQPPHQPTEAAVRHASIAATLKPETVAAL